MYSTTATVNWNSNSWNYALINCTTLRFHSLRLQHALTDYEAAVTRTLATTSCWANALKVAEMDSWRHVNMLIVAYAPTVVPHVFMRQNLSRWFPLFHCMHHDELVNLEWNYSALVGKGLGPWNYFQQWPTSPQSMWQLHSGSAGSVSVHCEYQISNWASAGAESYLFYSTALLW